MSIDAIINLLVSITLFEMMTTIGLGVTVADVERVAKDWRLVGGAAVANFIVVPAIAVALLFGFHTPALVAAGFLMAAVCPGAPYGPPFTGLAKGEVPVAVGLMALLAAASALLSPLALHVALPLTSGEEKLDIDVKKIVMTLLVTQLLPLAIGMVVRAYRPALAQRLAKPGKLLSLALNLGVFGLILWVQERLLLGIPWTGFAGMAALALASLAAGWIFGSRHRTAMAFSTGVRNVGVSLVIATASFPGTPAITAALAYALFQTLLLAAVAALWGRLARA